MTHLVFVAMRDEDLLLRFFLNPSAESIIMLVTGLRPNACWIMETEREKLITRQPPKQKQYDYNSENFQISARLRSSSRTRQRGEGREGGRELRDKGNAIEVVVGVDSAKSEIKV